MNDGFSAPEIEQSTLSAMMQWPECMNEGVNKLCQDHFDVPANRTIYNELLRYRGEGQPFDLVVFTHRLHEKGVLDQIGGASYLTSTFVNGCHSKHSFGVYMPILFGASARRELFKICKEVSERNLESEATPVEDTIARLLAIQTHSKKRLPAIEDATDFIDRVIETPPDLIDGLVHRGSKMVLGGTSKGFKTWLQSDLAVSVASGSPWLGQPTHKGRVLYINLELPRPFFQKRIQAVARARSVTLDDLGLLKVWNLRGHAANLTELLPKLLEEAGGDKFDLIIIDPIYKVLGNRDENRAGDIAGLCNEIERLAVESGAAVVFGSHFSKGNQSGKDSIDRIGGSGVFARDPDSILIFTRHEEENAFSVEATLRNHPPLEPFVVRWEFPLMQIDHDLDPSKLKQIGGREKKFHAEPLLALLDVAPLKTSDWKEVAESKLKMSRPTFMRLRKELEEDEKIEKDDRDRWSQKA